MTATLGFGGGHLLVLTLLAFTICKFAASHTAAPADRGARPIPPPVGGSPGRRVRGDVPPRSVVAPHNGASPVFSCRAAGTGLLADVHPTSVVSPAARLYDQEAEG